MIEIATALLFDKNGRLLCYLRDDKPSIPFPNHWDLFGGYVEDGESPEQALVREIKEELDIDLKVFHKFKSIDCSEGDVHKNVKHVFFAKIEQEPFELILQEGQRLDSFDLKNRADIKFANILGEIVDEFANSSDYEAFKTTF